MHSLYLKKINKLYKLILLCKGSQLDRTIIKGVTRIHTTRQTIGENHLVWWHRAQVNAGGLCIMTTRAVD